MVCKKRLYFFVVLLIASVSCANTKEGGDATLTLGGSMKESDNKNDEILINRAVEALSDYLNVSIDASSKDVTLLSVEKVDWSNPSLGCPKPGFFYPQVIVPGNLVNIVYQETVYPVHMSDKRSVICLNDNNVVNKNKKSIISSKKLDDFKRESILIEVRKDFQQRTGIPNNEIKVVAVKSAVWANSALGCPERNKVYDENKVKGFRVVIEARGRQYTYHTDEDKKIIACPNILSK